VRWTVNIELVSRFERKFETFQVFDKFRASHRINEVENDEWHSILELDLLNEFITADPCALIFSIVEFCCLVNNIAKAFPSLSYLHCFAFFIHMVNSMLRLFAFTLEFLF